MKKKTVQVEKEKEIVTEVAVKKVAKLDISFQNEDMNKVVEKINEIIDHVNV